MLLALFQRNESQPAHGANADKNCNDEHNDRPLKYGSWVHFFATDEH
jgi:hypothetical protein